MFGLPFSGGGDSDDDDYYYYFIEAKEIYIKEVEPSLLEMPRGAAGMLVWHLWGWSVSPSPGQAQLPQLLAAGSIWAAWCSGKRCLVT